MTASLLLSAAACGGDDKPPPTGDPVVEGASLEAYADDLVTLTCEKAAGCCAPIELESLFPLSDPKVTDQASCEQFLGNFGSGTLVSLVQASINAGRAAWDEATAAACLKKLGDLSCDAYAAVVQPFGNAPLDCNPIVGKVADGGVCAAWWECTSGSCSGASAESEGKCAPLPVAGEPCSQTLCAKGLYCDPTNETCQPLKADGAACAIDLECASNGCSNEYEVEGVCGEAAMCDADLTDDQHELYGACDNTEVIGDKSNEVACRLGTSAVWQCTCAVNGMVMSECSPGGAELQDVCVTNSCCMF
jgi:hypothetical protein